MEIKRTEPWLVETAIDLINAFLKRPKPIVFEFGQGASSEWLFHRAFKYCSVEHNKEYYQSFFAIYKQFPYDVPESHLQESPYNTCISQYQDEYFDLILVDGRDRVKCIQSSIPKLKKEGWLVLDNSEREYYQPGIELMKEWNRIDCKQNKPDKYVFTYPNWTTSIFIKP